MEELLGEPLYFVSVATELRPSEPLCPGGSEKIVTEANKCEYLTLLCEHFLCGGMQEQIQALLAGFWDIFPRNDLRLAELDHRDLALLIAGYGTLDVKEWKSHAKYNSSIKTVEWFWEVLATLSGEERARLLHFVTGNSRLPPQGFAGISPAFTISVATWEDVGHLPHAHTCANSLVLPMYSTREELKDKLLIALANDGGFGFM